MTVTHGVLGSSPCSGASRGMERLVVRAESFLEKRQSLSKIAQRFADNKNLLTFAPPKQQSGSLAQLVQSICLTSRGSAVRIRQLPQKNRNDQEFFLVVFFVFFVYLHFLLKGLSNKMLRHPLLLLKALFYSLISYIYCLQFCQLEVV